MKIADFYFPDDLYYSRNHFWAGVQDSLIVMGATDFYQRSVGLITAVEFKYAYGMVEQGKIVASVQPGDWLGPVCAVVSGEIVKVNDELKKNPSLVNTSPYRKGWLIQILPSNQGIDLLGLIRPGPGLYKMIEEEMTWLQEVFRGERPCC
ncbi:MAG: glycine cleavage system protein H [Pseudomonadota bacterium]